jgi:hypothetical protein
VSSFSSLASYLFGVASGLGPIINEVKKAVATAVLDPVVRGTPVDTGKARSNWIVSLGTPVLDIISPYSPGSHLGIAETGNADAAIAQGLDVISSSQSADETIVIQNNVPYIQPLDDGHSRQAPAMFVESAIFVGLANLDNITLLV